MYSCSLALLLPFVIAPPLFPTLSPLPCVGSPYCDLCGDPLLLLLCCMGYWPLPCVLTVWCPSGIPQCLARVDENLFSFHDGHGCLQHLLCIGFQRLLGTQAVRLEAPGSPVPLQRDPHLSDIVQHLRSSGGHGYPELWLSLVLLCGLRTERVCPGGLRWGRLSCAAVWTSLLSSAPSPGSGASGPGHLYSGTVQE